MQIHTIQVSDFDQNSRILYKDLECIVVDPGGDIPKIDKFLKSENLIPKAVLLTHSHLDHAGGVADFLEKYKVPLYGHPAENWMRGNITTIATMYGLNPNQYKTCPEPDTLITGGETIEFIGEKFKVLFTPGHSPGHVCFYNAQNNILIAGDTLFQASIGRTDLPGGDSNILLQSIKEKILVLPGETKVLSGHGPDTTIKREIESNPYL